MSDCRVELTAAAARQIRKPEPPVRRRLLVAIAKLGSDPCPHGVKKLSGDSNVRRIRVGDYRVMYEIHDAALLVVVFRAANRREAY